MKNQNQNNPNRSPFQGGGIVTSTAVPLPMENVDTDQIIPARFLKAVSREGFGENLFRDRRYDPLGHPVKNFVLNDPRFSGRILVAGKNFGCGSSREHAAWALKDYGFDVVISSFFADIFQNNALNNFLLPVVLPDPQVRELLDLVQKEPSTSIEIDLEAEFIRVPVIGMSARFPINSYKKTCLSSGYDDLDYLLSLKTEREAFERTHG